jgi:release factor glutamine methyltransferase
VSSPELEARLIVQRASGKSREDYLRDGAQFSPAEFELAVSAMQSRRLRGEPVAYITGEWEFYSLPIKVSREVLIPRADSEVIVDRAIARLAAREPPARVLDLCAGSGCLGLAVAENVPSAKVVLAEKFPGAIRLCRINTLKNSLTRQVISARVDALETPPRLFGRFDVILCNPPYIPSGDIAGLDNSVRGFEPRRALDGGADGLDFFKAVAGKWKAVIKSGGWLIFECGAGQAEYVVRIMRENGFNNIEVTRDTAGIARAVEGKIKI